MPYTTIQQRAIRHHADQNDLVPQLSVYPKVTFKSRSTGEITEINVINLVSYYNKYKKEHGDVNK